MTPTFFNHHEQELVDDDSKKSMGRRERHLHVKIYMAALLSMHLSHVTVMAAGLSSAEEELAEPRSAVLLAEELEKAADAGGSEPELGPSQGLSPSLALPGELSASHSSIAAQQGTTQEVTKQTQRVGPLRATVFRPKGWSLEEVDS